jgi:hypothetical protein
MKANMKSDWTTVPFALAFAPQKSTSSFQQFTLIRTTLAELSSPFWRGIQPVGQSSETFEVLPIDDGSGADVMSVRNKKISARVKELRVRWITKATQTIEVKNRK